MLVLKLDPDITERDYAREPLKRAEVTKIVDVVGAVEPLLKTRHKLAKERGWKDKPPAKSTFVKAVVEDNNLLNRPVILRGRKAVVGYDEAAIRKILA